MQYKTQQPYCTRFLGFTLGIDNGIFLLITQKSKHASEEGSSNNLPYPKTVQLPNIIERFMASLGNLIGILSTQDDSDYDKYH